MKLLRQPGRRIVLEDSLAKAITPPRADPNSYYLTLGLDPRKVWSQDEVKTAFRDQAKKLHPDGSEPDPVAYDRLQVAYAVLRDPELRRRYDAMDSTQMWRDKDVIAAIIKKVAEARRKGGEVQEMAPLLKEALQERGPKAPPGPRYESYAYYYYEGEEPPEAAVRERWVEAVMQAAWGLGKRSEIRLGFTTGDPHVVEKSWGQVLMASGDPSTEAAFALVELLDDSSEFGPHDGPDAGKVGVGHTS